MTEQEWVECEDPEGLLNEVGKQLSERKLRLFACACCRRVWPLLGDAARRAIIVTEDLIEGSADHEDWIAAWEVLRREDNEADLETTEDAVVDAQAAVMHAVRPLTDRAGWYQPTGCSWAASASHVAALATVEASGRFQGSLLVTEPWLRERKLQAAVLRDILGNPFRPQSVDPSWLVSNGGVVSSMAQATYADKRAPDGTLDLHRFPILTDALEDAGCSDETLLSHLRGPGPHVRGCWVIDLLLHKE
jgi:hypothetical protein